MKLKGEELNTILDDLGDLEFSGNIDNGILNGYNLKIKSHGDHRNDGQMVDYTLTFVSPKGAKTVVKTEISLMNGWDFYEPILIK